MSLERARQAAHCAHEMAEAFERVRAVKPEAMQAAMTLTLAHAYLSEYARLLEAGMDPEEAIAEAVGIRLESGVVASMMRRLVFTTAEPI
jgi:hypothetical protein